MCGVCGHIVKGSKLSLRPRFISCNKAARTSSFENRALFFFFIRKFFFSRFKLSLPLYTSDTAAAQSAGGCCIVTNRG